MNIQTNAFYLGKQNLHSSKTGKDYVKFALSVEGQYASFIVPKKKADEIEQKSPKIFEQFAKNHIPQNCVVTLDIAFTERGNFVGVEEIK